MILESLEQADLTTTVLSKAGLSMLNPFTAWLPVAEGLIKATGLDKKIGQIFGARSPRFSNEECLRILNNLWADNLGRNPNQNDLNAWFQPLLYGYEDVNSLTNIIKSGDEYKQRKAYFWNELVKAEQQYLGRTPTTTPDTDLWFKQLMAGQITLDQFKQVLMKSGEHAKTLGNLLIPASIVAGAILLL